MNEEIEEACRVVAYAGGYRDAFNPCDNKFENNAELKQYLSLDTLIPIWEKLMDIKFGTTTDNKFQVVQFAADIMIKSHALMYMHGYTILEAACIATANSIRDLE